MVHKWDRTVLAHKQMRGSPAPSASFPGCFSSEQDPNASSPVYRSDPEHFRKIIKGYSNTSCAPTATKLSPGKLARRQHG